MRYPLIAVNPFASAIPNIFIASVLTPNARIIFSLFPVARIARPKSVFNNQIRAEKITRMIRVSIINCCIANESENELEEKIEG